MTITAQYQELRKLIDEDHDLTHEDAVLELTLLIEEHAAFQDAVQRCLHLLAHVPVDVLNRAAADVMRCESQQSTCH
jgi:hypothetical protein